MDIQFKSFEACSVVGLPILSHSSTIQQDAPLLWNKLRECISEIPSLSVSPKCIGLEFYPRDFLSSGNFYYMPSFVVNDLITIPASMCGKTIPGGLHAVFTHQGSIASIKNTFHFIYSEWLPKQSEYVLSSNYDMEIYDERFKRLDEKSELEIWLPVKKL